MGLGRQQVNAAIDASITDPLNRQNTAAVVRAVYKLLSNNFFNVEDDELSIGNITNLQTTLTNITNSISNLSVADIDGLTAALEDAGGLKEWVAGAKKAGAHYTLPGQLWKVKVNLASDAVAPTVENANWQLVIDTTNPTRKIDKEYLFKFDEVSIDPDATVWRTKKILISAVTFSSQIASVSFEVKADLGAYIPKATFGDVNDWIQTNISNGSKYFIKVNRVAVANAAGEGWVEMIYKEIA